MQVPFSTTPVKGSLLLLTVRNSGAIQQNPALVSTIGVKRTSLLNSLQLVHTSDNYAVDIIYK